MKTLLIVLLLTILSGCAGGMNACFNCQHYTYAGSNNG